MKALERALLVLGVLCHLVGMPLAEWVDARWFYMVLAGEMLLGAYTQIGWENDHPQKRTIKTGKRIGGNRHDNG